MKITMIPDENHVRRKNLLMKITVIPDGNHGDGVFVSDEDHDMQASLLTPRTISALFSFIASQFLEVWHVLFSRFHCIPPTSKPIHVILIRNRTQNRLAY